MIARALAGPAGRRADCSSVGRCPPAAWESTRPYRGQPPIDESFVRAFEQFRTSYVLRFSPKGVERGGWHDLTVRVTRRGRHDVRARTGYQG